MNNKFYVNDRNKTPVKLTDTKKNFNILKKVIPAILIFAFAVGLANFIGLVDIDNLFGFNKANESTIIAAEEVPVSDGELTELPRIIEKSVFESFLTAIPKGSHKRSMESYYALKDFEQGEFYVFDRYAKERETNQILAIWNEYINWNDAAYFNMLVHYQMLDSMYLHAAPEHSSFEPVNYNNTNEMYRTADIDLIEEEFALRDPALYSHVRFGENKNFLLLEVEWYTPESYAEMMEDFKNSKSGYKDYDWYIQLTDDEKAKADVSYEEYYEKQMKENEKLLEEIKNKSAYVTKTVNGTNKNAFIHRSGDGSRVNVSSLVDSNGYYRQNIYPNTIGAWYKDENGVQKHIEWGLVCSKQEFDYVMENEALPFLNELLEKGLIREQDYNDVIKDPLDRDVERFFGKADGQ